MPPVGQNLICRERPGERLERGHAAAGLGGEELHQRDAVLEQAQDLAGGDGAGQERATRVRGGRGERVGAPWRDDELRAGVACVEQLLWRGHGAGADDRLRDLGRDPLDRLEPGLGPQRDLEHLQSAGDSASASGTADRGVRRS